MTGAASATVRNRAFALAQRFLRHLALGDIAGDTAHAGGFALFVQLDASVACDPARPSVRVDDAIFAFVISLPGHARARPASSIEARSSSCTVGESDEMRLALLRAKPNNARPFSVSKMSSVSMFQTQRARLAPLAARLIRVSLSRSAASLMRNCRAVCAAAQDVIAEFKAHRHDHAQEWKG